ncbi:MAG TPA: hypothetical protein VLG44_07365 [Chlamydiales bacterium]|nr:hypothetical protein [Chlamydiales bacterium]
MAELAISMLSKGDHYKEIVRSLLARILPEGKESLEFINDHLPIVKWTGLDQAVPGNLSILLFCKHRPNATEFFYDLISRWLLPPKQTPVEMFFSADFHLPELAQNPFSIAEIIVQVKHVEDQELIKKNLKAIDTEIRLGVLSNYQANRILEFKGLPQEGKIAMIQEKIGSLIQTRAGDYDKNIFSEMQRFLVSCMEEFKSLRDYHHISRIISILYLLRKTIQQKTCSFPNRRHLLIKFVKTRLAKENWEKNVLGILIGLNFIKDNEVFEKVHLVNALKNLPGIKPVENSFILDRSREKNIQTLYMEIEKDHGEDFSLDEIQTLKESLPHLLKGHIEYLMHPIFMPRNEEEILRNIMVLSRQLKYIHDIPQVIISFDEQVRSELSFTVISIRLLKTPDSEMETMIRKYQGKARILIDRIRTLGALRKKYPKEATVLRVMLPVDEYFRPDNSVDLYRARKDVAMLMNHLLGNMRDYNGGMIYQQNEQYVALKAALGINLSSHELILEKFFYALTPAHMRSVLEVDTLKTFFLLLLQLFKKDTLGSKPDFLFKEEQKKLYLVLPVMNSSQKKEMDHVIEKLEIPSHNLVSFYLDTYDSSYAGYLFLSEDKEKQKKFLQELQGFLQLSLSMV